MLAIKFVAQVSDVAVNLMRVANSFVCTVINNPYLELDYSLLLQKPHPISDHFNTKYLLLLLLLAFFLLCPLISMGITQATRFF